MILLVALTILARACMVLGGARTVLTKKSFLKEVFLLCLTLSVLMLGLEAKIVFVLQRTSAVTLPGFLAMEGD
jgi:hypothetical protein